MIKSGVVTAVEEQHGWGLGVPLKLLMLLEATGRWGSVLRQGLIHVGVFHDWEVVESTLFLQGDPRDAFWAPAP